MFSAPANTHVLVHNASRRVTERPCAGLDCTMVKLLALLNTRKYGYKCVQHIIER